MKTDNNNESFSKADFLNLESFYNDTKSSSGCDVLSGFISPIEFMRKTYQSHRFLIK